MKRHQVATRHDQTAIRGARESRDGALDLTGVAHIDWDYLYPERRRQGLDDAELGGTAWYAGIPKDRHTRSEERRVGKEGRSRWSAVLLKKETYAHNRQMRQ